MIRLPCLLLAAFSFAASAFSLLAADSISSLSAPYPKVGDIERLDPALDALLAPDAHLEKLAEGFRWSEGPVWLAAQHALVFSDTQANTAYRWREGHGIDVFLHPSGYTGTTAFDGREPGSNGLTVDAEGHVLLCQHGDRRVARLNADGKTFTTLADHYTGKRFNSPNDLCVDRAGRIYFTDPPYGLPNHTKSEMGFAGVYRIENDGRVTLITKELDHPNGIALSPDQKTLYVDNSDGSNPVIIAIPLHDDGTWGASHVVFNATALIKQGRRGGPDGMKIDRHGNIWSTGPGGIVILDPHGKHLGSLLTGQPTANLAWGDDGATLYITANNQLLRIRTVTTGAGW